MRNLGYLAIALLPLAVLGCGSGGSASDEAKIRSELSGPPMLHPGHHPGPANAARAGGNWKAGATGTTPGQAPPSGQ